jgi:uncharacterized membrane protein
MAERPRDRTTIIAGIITIAAMLLIAAIFLLISSPWNDPGPRPHKPKPVHTTQHR